MLTQLADDPVFQLNLAIWMLIDKPGKAPVRPILHNAGYSLRAISRPVTVSPGRRAALRSLVNSDDPASPDIICNAPDEEPMLLLECKKASFSPQSSTARQTRKLLAAAADLSSALGVDRSGALVYFAQAPNHDSLAQTAVHCVAELKKLAIPSGSAGGLGIFVRDDGFYVQASRVGVLPERLKRATSDPVLVLDTSTGQDPRPLYIIPWDPTVQNQSDEERQFCWNILAAQVLMHALKRVGQSITPAHVVLPLEAVLSDATYGVSNHWPPGPDKRQILREVGKILREAVRPGTARLGVVLQAERSLELTLNDDDDLQFATDLLEKADPSRQPPDPNDQLGLEGVN